MEDDELAQRRPEHPDFKEVPLNERWWEEKGKWWGEVAAAESYDDNDGVEEMAGVVIPPNPIVVNYQRHSSPVSSAVNWAEYMPRQRTQAKVIAWNWGGSCTVHAFADAVMARLWMRETNSVRKFGVDVASLTHLAAAKGVLTKDGSSANFIGKMTQEFGIPLVGDVPTVGDSAADPYALNISVTSCCMPAVQNTELGREALLRYREGLCRELEKGPVVAAIAPQIHYGQIKRKDTVYRHDRNGKSLMVADPVTGQLSRAHHCIALYSYQCPDGNVKMLELGYQENAEGGRPRGQIDASCILSYHAPCVDEVQYSAGRPAAKAK